MKKTYIILSILTCLLLIAAACFVDNFEKVGMVLFALGFICGFFARVYRDRYFAEREKEEDSL